MQRKALSESDRKRCRRNVWCQPGLPDGLFLNQKSWFGKILEGLRWEKVAIFFGHLQYFTDEWDILWPFATFCVHLVCTCFPVLVSWTKKNLATLVSIKSTNSYCSKAGFSSYKFPKCTWETVKASQFKRKTKDIFVARNNLDLIVSDVQFGNSYSVLKRSRFFK
jgi:hypothetical protein